MMFLYRAATRYIPIVRFFCTAPVKGPVVRLEKLPYTIRKEQLKDFFGNCKLASGLNSIHIIMNNEGRSSGLGYLELAAEEDQHRALGLDQSYFPRFDRPAIVKKCDLEELKWYMNRKNTFQDSKYPVEMSGLPFRATEYEIASWFGNEAPCCDVEIHTNDRGQPTGRATAFFDTEEQADKAMTKHREDMQGRYIILSLNSGPVVRDDFRVRMSGLPFEATEDEVKEFFSDVANCVGFEVITNNFGRSIGVGYAKFESEADAAAAMKKNQEYIGNRYVILSRPGGRSQ